MLIISENNILSISLYLSTRLGAASSGWRASARSQALSEVPFQKSEFHPVCANGETVSEYGYLAWKPSGSSSLLQKPFYDFVHSVLEHRGKIPPRVMVLGVSWVLAEET